MKILDFLKWVYYDFKHPRPYLPQGVTVFSSDVGTGKTVSIVEYLNRVRSGKIFFGKTKIFTNFSYEYQDGNIDTVDDMLATPNNSVLAIDELNRLFNSHDWRTVPGDFLQLLTQNRKMAKQLVGSCQSFSHINAELRDNVNEVVEVSNLRSRWFFQKFYHRDDYTRIQGRDDEFKAGKCYNNYNFVASNDLFESYDTYRIVEKLKDCGVRETSRTPQILPVAIPVDVK